MKGLVLTYILTAVGSVASLRRPLIGLYLYMGFAVLRPQAIFSWAGDISNVSLILGVSLLIGWVLNGFGSWRVGRARPILLTLLGYTAWYALATVSAARTEAAMPALIELLKIVLPFCVGMSMMETEQDWRRLL